MDLIKILEERNFKYQDFCCLDMAYYLSFEGLEGNVEDDTDVIVQYSSKTKEFGIPIHDGGGSQIKINYCPWCGKEI
jgi:hypothetical protein